VAKFIYKKMTEKSSKQPFYAFYVFHGILCY
jgi:hypothetical protein